MWKTHLTCRYYQPNTVTIHKPVNLALFDMDGTITVPASGRRFVAKDDSPDDWVYLGRVIERFRQLHDDGWIIGIVSNQSRYHEGIGRKFESIRADLHEQLGWSPFIFMATKEDQFRKPNIGMPLLMLQLLGITAADIDSIAMSGDMIGDDEEYPPYRIGNADYQLAVNLRQIAPCDFYRPYDMFGRNYPDDYIVQEREVILMVGNPGAGKSTLAAKLGVPIVNQDTLTTKAKVLQHIDQLVRQGKSLVIDATHPGLDKRNEVLAAPRRAGYQITIFWFIRPGQPFNQLRERKINDMVYGKYANTFVRPTSVEGKIIQIY